MYIIIFFQKQYTKYILLHEYMVLAQFSGINIIDLPVLYDTIGAYFRYVLTRYPGENNAINCLQ